MNVPTASRLNRYLTVILRWLVITAIVFVLTLLGGFFIIENVLHKVYTATAQIKLIPIGATPSSSLKDSSQFQAEFEIMESSDVLLPVIYDLGLDKAWAKRIDKSGLDDLPPPDALLPQDALAYMHTILKLDYVRGTNIVNITVSSDVPIEAARIANAIADRYKTMRDVEEDQRTNRGTDALREQFVQQRKVVDEKKTALEKISDHQSPAYRDAQRDLDQQQSLLDALTVRFKQAVTSDGLQESPVWVVARAEPPEYPSKPNRKFDFVVTIVMAGFLSLAVASFVEIILLFLRASERTDN